MPEHDDRHAMGWRTRRMLELVQDMLSTASPSFDDEGTSDFDAYLEAFREEVEILGGMDFATEGERSEAWLAILGKAIATQMAADIIEARGHHLRLIEPTD